MTKASLILDKFRSMELSEAIKSHGPYIDRINKLNKISASMKVKVAIKDALVRMSKDLSEDEAIDKFISSLNSDSDVADYVNYFESENLGSKQGYTAWKQKQVKRYLK